MPYLKIQTNTPIDPHHGRTLISKASQLVAQHLGKPERYVMVALQAGTPMVFAGEDAPLAYLELKSIGLPKHATPELSKALCELLTDNLDIPADRVYIEFADAQPAMWGWDSGTF
jgi:phenylpyruvate tautomerase PptA (4-oxalocrotonate tautomerase family)